MVLCLFIALALPLVQVGVAEEPTGPSPLVRAPIDGDGESEPNPVDFIEIPGVQELTSRLIARPWQRLDLAERGVPFEQAFELQRQARHEVQAYEVVRYVPQTGEYILRVPEGRTEEEVAEALSSTGHFEYVVPDWRVFPLSQQSITRPRTGASLVSPQLIPNCPDEPLMPLQWHHKSNRIASCEAWQRTTGDPSVSIAYCDTGLRTTHEELQQHRLEAYNAVDQLWESEGGSIGAVMGHGTRVTGTVAATGDNGLGVAGLAWNLSHRMVRVSNQSNGHAALSDIQHGARTAVERGDRVASTSYQGAWLASNPATATYIKSRGGLWVWGAGNSSSNLSHVDRDSDDLIVVGSTNQADGLAWFSIYGSFVDLVAPGVAIWTPDSANDNDYGSPEGTSYSCPLVSGVCGLLWSERPTLSPNDVERILKLGAEDIGAPGIDDVFGYGRIQLFDTLNTSGVAIPSADFAGHPITGVSPLSVDFVDLSSGVPTSWLWDFGDGQTSTAQNPTHVFTGPGAFAVSLTATNELGADQHFVLDYVLVDIIPPVAEFSASPTAGLSPLIVQFADESTGGIPTSWLWEFGDGQTSTDPDPAHTYTSEGSYAVSLTVTNAYGTDELTMTGYVVVDWIPPVAEFSGNPLTGNSPMVVQFTDLSTGGVATSWQWIFGDGGSSTEQHPAHTYTAEGTYSVWLTASNAYGSDQVVKSGYVSVGPGPPLISDFVGSPLTGPAPLTVNFTDLSLGDVTDWEWNFGDDETSNLQHPTHVYTTPGEYDVALSVGNADGADVSEEKQKYIIVQ